MYPKQPAATKKPVTPQPQVSQGTLQTGPIVSVSNKGYMGTFGKPVPVCPECGSRMKVYTMNNEVYALDCEACGRSERHCTK